MEISTKEGPLAEGKDRGDNVHRRLPGDLRLREVICQRAGPAEGPGQLYRGRETQGESSRVLRNGGQGTSKAAGR